MFSELLRTLAKLFNSLLVFWEEVTGGREGGRRGGVIQTGCDGGAVEGAWTELFLGWGWRWVYDFVLVCV